MNLYRRIAVVGLVLVGISFGQGVGAKRAMTFADLMAMKRVSDPQVSPGGKWVLFSVTDVSLSANTKTNHLWVVPVGGGDGGNAGSSAALRNDNKRTTAETTTNADSSAALRNDKQGGDAERQVTFGDGEANGRFSPDGEFVSISMKDQIYLAAWDETGGKLGEAKALTGVSTGADGAVWSPDSKRLLFVSSVYPECSVTGGGDDAVAGPTHRDTAAMNGAQTLIGARSFVEEDACDKAKDEAAEKSPVKAQLFTGLLYRHWNAFTGVKRSHVLMVNVDGTGVRDLTPASVVGDAETPTFSLGGPLGYAWAPDSKEIAYVTNLDAVKAASTNNDVFTLRLDEPGARAVKVSTSLGSDDGPAYSPDGRWLAFRSQARAGYESDRFRLMVFDRQAKTIKELMPKFDRWVDEFVWAPDSKMLYFASGNHGETQVLRVSEQIGGIDVLWSEATDPELRQQAAEYSELSISRLGDTLVGTKMSAYRPASLVRYDLSRSKDSKAQLSYRDNASVILQYGLASKATSIEAFLTPESALTHINDSLIDALSLDEMESFQFAGAGDAKVQGFVVRPPDFDPKKKYPVKFLIHGGPQGAWGDAWSYRWNPELMAASGYVVVMVNPRGSTGYGQAFIDGVNGDWGGKAYEDLMKGLDAAEKQFPFIDKDRECALGASYGGFMANWMLTHTNRFKCIVTHDGMYNPAAAYGDTEEMWFNEWEFRRAGEKEPGQPWRYASLPADQDPFRKWSPMLHIQDAKTPTLVIHSQKDYRLDVSEGFQLFTALQRLNVPSEMLYFPDEGHWVGKPKNAELWNKTVEDWCDRWTHTNAYAGAR